MRCPFRTVQERIQVQPILLPLGGYLCVTPSQFVVLLSVFTMRVSCNFFLALALLCSCSDAFTASLSNLDLRYTTDGQLVNAHSGGLYRFNSTFYLYGTAYENCTQDGPVCTPPCGYYNNIFVAYSSPDLVSWTLVNDNLVPGINADSAAIEYDEVNVGFCAERGDYVLTFWSGHYGFKNSKIAVARSATPVGPFTLAEPIVATGGEIISDTVGLFVDDDGTAYVRYNTRDAPLRHVVERLTPDWASSTGEHSVIFSKQDFPWYDGEETR